MTDGTTAPALARTLVEIHRTTSERALCDLIAQRGEAIFGCPTQLQLTPPTPPVLVATPDAPAGALELDLEFADPGPPHGAPVELVIEHLETAVLNLRRGAELAFRAERFEALIERIPAVTYFEHAIDEAMIYVSPQIETLFGIPRGSWLAPGDAWGDRIHDHDRAEIVSRYKAFIARGGTFHAEYRIIDPTGAIRWVRDEASRTIDESGNPGWIQGVLVEITERKMLEAELSHRAYHDPLTDLPNRVRFRQHVEQAIARARRSASSIAVLYIDLDGFKAINDSCGHRTGDELLCQIAARIRARVKASDVVSREGGDEFAVLLSELPPTYEGAIVAITDTLAREIAKPTTLRDTTLAVAASIGAAVFPRDGQSVDEILEHADKEMYRAKRAALSRRIAA